MAEPKRIQLDTGVCLVWPSRLHMGHIVVDGIAQEIRIARNRFTFLPFLGKEYRHIYHSLK